MKLKNILGMHYVYIWWPSYILRAHCNFYQQKPVKLQITIDGGDVLGILLSKI